MRISITKLMLLLIFVMASLGAWAEVNEYTFTSALGTYTEITGGTVLGSSANDNESFDAIPLGFTFTFNEVEHTVISVQTNGFLAFGPTVATSNTAISAATGTNNIVAVLNRDIRSRDDGSLTYLLSGTAPNRVFTVQWKNYRRNPTSAANDIFNFQIQLHEAGNAIKLVYGSFTAVNVSTAATVQVGLRGDSSADFNNRTTSTDWTATTAGTANNANCRITDLIYPPDGLIFTFAPVQQGEVPSAAQTPNPANNATDVNVNAILSWLSGGGVVDGYKVYLGTDNPPTNLVNGTIVTTASYDHPTSFIYSTAYYWKIVPFNQYGDAANCPVWQFTSLADPTISTFPYVQNFDSVTPPALPLGWTTLNLNGDAYTWETYAGTANSAPNSVRIRYNTTTAMNDWLITPPLSLEAETNYQLKFWYRANSTTYPEALSVFWGNQPTEAALTNQLYSNTNITNDTYQQITVAIPEVTAGTYYIGFKGHSPADRFYLYLDDVSIIEVTDSMDPPNNLTATVNGNNVHLSWLAPGDTPPPPPSLNDGFETYTDFALDFAPWVCVDVDQSGTYGVQGYSWPNVYAAMAYMIFNPTTTTPALTNLEAHGGSKMAASFASTSAVNNDWLISPMFTPQAGQYFNFWARSYVSDYGLERFKVGVSTSAGTQPANFTIISTGSYIQAPITWTLYSYDLTAYAGQEIRMAINCVSDDAFFLLVDDVTVGAIPTRGHDHYAGLFMGELTRSTGTAVPVPTMTRDLLGYKVYRDGALIHTINSAATLAFDDQNLTVGTYSYTVTAVYTAGESIPAGPVSATIQAPMDPPTNLTATVNGNTVTLDWLAPGDTPPPPEGQWITWCNDVLGNSIGTNGVATFDVAHRYTQADLASVAGGVISQVKFVPGYDNCVYTVKVWTGGSATNAGTLVSSKVATSPVIINQWNTVVLTTPVPIPTTGDVYIGFECNTQGGYPAGCDAGPPIAGKGNMMYFNGVWQPLTNLAASLTYNWLIQAYVGSGDNLRMIELKPIAEAPRPIYPKAQLAVHHTEVSPLHRNHTGFKVYRGGTLIATITNPATVTYADAGLAIGTYSYTVTATYAGGESVPAGPVSATIQGTGGPAPLNLTADVSGHDVTLNWESPEAPQPGEWITWCTDVLGNSIGTGSAATFAVAHRFTQADLTQVAGGTIAQVKFVPAHESCVYTVKVWTGGTATNAGTLVSSQLVNNPVIDDWNTVVLNTPVPIPTTGDVYIGYEANTQGGYPAGCDAGPPIAGKGNMMYFQGAWQPLTDLAASLTYNWLINTFVVTGTTMKEIRLSPIAEKQYTNDSKAQLAVLHKDIQSRRAVAGFKVYRDGELIATLNDPLATTYVDLGVDNGTYLYGVTAVHTTGESDPTTIQVVVDVQLSELIFEDDFESYPDFATLFAPWTLIDQDLSPTYGISNVSFPGSEDPMAYIIFNPTQTTPPLTDVTGHSGTKMAAAFAAVMPAQGGTGPNSDWMISPRMQLGTDSAVRLYVRSHTANYGLERFRVGVSMNPNIVTGGWQWQGGTSYDQAPTTWTEFLYDISSFDGQAVRVAVRCVSEDAFVFYVDDFSIHSNGGYPVDADDPVVPAISTKLENNYPNPFNPQTTIRYSLAQASAVMIEIYNVKGQLVKTLVKDTKEAGNHSVVWNGKDNNNRSVSSGIYYYKMSAGKYSNTRKMILMK